MSFDRMLSVANCIRYKQTVIITFSFLCQVETPLCLSIYCSPDICLHYFNGSHYFLLTWLQFVLGFFRFQLIPKWGCMIYLSCSRPAVSTGRRSVLRGWRVCLQNTITLSDRPRTFCARTNTFTLKDKSGIQDTYKSLKKN